MSATPVALREIASSPFRTLNGQLFLSRARVRQLQREIGKKGPAGIALPARRASSGGRCQIVYGHHLAHAALLVCGPDATVGLDLRERDDRAMILGYLEAMDRAYHVDDMSRSVMAQRLQEIDAGSRAITRLDAAIFAAERQIAGGAAGDSCLAQELGRPVSVPIAEATLF